MTQVEVLSGHSLAENEQVIERHLSSFIETGRALMWIRDERQYLEAGFDTFEDYCRQRWDLSRSHAVSQIDGVRVVDVVSARADIEPPQFEFHARPLVKVLNQDGEDAVVEAWRQITERHKDEGPISGREVSRFLSLGANYGKPGWHELLGEIGDILERAQKQMAKFEDAIGGRSPAQSLQEKAQRYAAQADDLSERLRGIR